MENRNDIRRWVSRRSFLHGLTAAGAAAALARSSLGALAEQSALAKPDSVFGGVHIGCITYSYRGNINTAEDTLKALLEDGLSECELMDGPIRAYTGITAGGRGGRGRRGGAAQSTTRPALSDTERAQQRSAQLAKCVDLRKTYNDAGVNIHCEKLPFGQSDEEFEFNFQVAKALGCKAITTERSESLARKVAPFAEKHKIWVAFHNHTNNVPVTDDIDPILAIGPYIGFNLDIGHYFAGTKGKSPVPVIEKYHDRIISLHLKDRTADGGNLPWGQGKTPIREALQLLKKEKWPIYADIELEYPIPAGSTSVAEVAKCVEYCRAALS